MLRVDTSKFKPRGRRQWFVWLTLALLLIIGTLLGFLIPRADTTIEFGHGSLFRADNEQSAAHFVASEYHGTYTTLWLIAADDLDGKRIKVSDIPHANGWDIAAAVNLNTRTIAALTIPPAGWDPAKHAALLLIDAQGARQVAGGLDLRGGVVWSDDGHRVVVRRDRAIAVIETESGREIGAWLPPDVRSAHSIAMRGDMLWLALLGSGGTFVAQLQLDGGGLTLLNQQQVSAEMTRDWTLSPDGNQLAFTEQRGLSLHVSVVPTANTSEPWVSKRWLVGDQAAATARRSYVRSASPVWRTDGTLEIGSWSDADERFTLPTAWHESGQWLALRSLSGAGPGDVTAERLVLRGPGNELSEAPEGIRFVGWWAA